MSMHISNNIAPLTGFLGGAMVAVSASLMMLFCGKLASPSKALSSATIFNLGSEDPRWSWSFVTGLIASGAILIQ